MISQSIFKKKRWALTLASLPWIFAGPGAFASKITSIDFKGGKGASEVDITSDGPVTFEKQENTADKQIVVDLKGASLSKNAKRKLDTSSFNSKVSLVSPYSVNGTGGNDSRVVIQLKDMVSGDVSQDGNTIRIKIPNGAAPEDAASAPADASANAATAPPPENTGLPSTEQAPPPPLPEGVEGAPAPSQAQTTPPPPAPTAASEAANAESKAQPQAPAPVHAQAPQASADQGNSDNSLVGRKKDALTEFTEAQATKRFSGRPITLQVRDAELTDVFRLIGETSGFNIVVGDDVKGKINLSMVDVPWDQALDVILHNQHLGAERNNNVLRIATLENLTKEKQQELQAQLAAENAAPRITRVFPISYAKLEDIQSLLTRFGSTTNGASSATGQTAGTTGSGGSVQADKRTNSLVVRDTPENIERMKKLIEILDTQTPQVIIEGKIIEATETGSFQINGSLGFSGNSDATFGAAFNGGNPTDQLIGGIFPTGASWGGGGSSGSSTGSTGGSTGGSGSSTSTVAGNTFGLSPNLSFLPGNLKLNAILSVLEQESKVRIVASPRTVVIDRENAIISQSQPIIVPTTTVVPGIGPTQGSTTLQAILKLDVTPSVTNEGSVLLKLNLERDTPDPNGSGPDTRTLQTNVLVDSGSTLAIGGIYSSNTTNSSSGFPFLRKIPIIGRLFGSENNSNQRTELFFFITPRILNPKEAGLNG